MFGCVCTKLKEQPSSLVLRRAAVLSSRFNLSWVDDETFCGFAFAKTDFSTTLVTIVQFLQGHPTTIDFTTRYDQ